MKHQDCDVKFEHFTFSGETIGSEVYGLPSERHTSSKGHLVLDLKLLYHNQVLLKLEVQGLIFHLLVLDILEENLLFLLMHMVLVRHMSYHLLVRSSWYSIGTTRTTSMCTALTAALLSVLGTRLVGTHTVTYLAVIELL